MKYILRRRPSPALVIACLALFVSLSGVSYGVATGFIDSREIKNNTVGSKDVRNNSLRTFDIRNNEIRGFDIRNSSVGGRDLAFNTITGSDVDESSLAKVPSAAAADAAATATAVSVLKPIAPITVAEGATPATLATHGPFTLSAACVDDAGDTEARVRVQSSEAGAAASNGNPSFGPADGPVTLAEASNVGGAPVRAAVTLPGFASAPSGKALTGQFGLVADSSAAGSCQFSGFVVLEG